MKNYILNSLVGSLVVLHYEEKARSYLSILLGSLVGRLEQGLLGRRR